MMIYYYYFVAMDSLRPKMRTTILR